MLPISWCFGVRPVRRLFVVYFKMSLVRHILERVDILRIPFEVAP